MIIIIVLQVINNNVISATNDSGKEMVIMGKGIGFSIKKGDEINEDKIEKIFTMDDRSDLEKLKEQLESIPIEIFKITTDIVNYAESIMNIQLNPKIYISLTDHINFAVANYKNKIFLNPLTFEIKYIYKDEYAIGRYATKLLNSKYGLDMGEDEAGNIALHIVNSSSSYQNGESVKIITFIKDMSLIIQNSFPNIDFNYTNVEINSFLSGLKYFAIELFEGKFDKSYNDKNYQKILNIMQLELKKQYNCIESIVAYTEKTYNVLIPAEEKIMLIILLDKILKNNFRE